MTKLIANFLNLHDRPHTVHAHVAEDGKAMVLVKTESGGTVLDLTPEGARALAAALSRAAMDVEAARLKSWVVYPLVSREGRVSGYGCGEFHPSSLRQPQSVLVHNATEATVQRIIEGAQALRKKPMGCDLATLFQRHGCDAIYRG